MKLDRSSFTGVFSSRSESWLVEQTPVMACITPWSQSAQEASLSSRHPSWKLLLISKCHKFHSLLFLGALTIGGEWRGGRRCSFFLSPSLLKRNLMLALSGICCQIHLTIIKSWSSTFYWYLKQLFQQTVSLVLFVEMVPPNSHYMMLLCHPDVNKRNCCDSEQKHYSCLASATGDSLWINEMSAEMSRLYPLDLSKRKNNLHGGIDRM